MNPYAYLGKNYTADDGTLTAAPSTGDKSEEKYAGAFLLPETGSDAWRAEITVTLDTLYSAAGLLFCASL